MTDPLARLARWPLHSLRRLILSLLVFAAFVAFIGNTVQGGGSSHPTAAAATATTASAPLVPRNPDTYRTVGDSSSSAPTTSSTTAATSTSAAASRPPVPDDQRQQITTLATNFVSAWAHPERSPEDWRKGVETYVTPTFYTQLTSVDPANVPATVITGQPTITAGSTDEATVIVPTDAGNQRVIVTTASGTGTWAVSSIAKAN